MIRGPTPKGPLPVLHRTSKPARFNTQEDYRRKSKRIVRACARLKRLGCPSDLWKFALPGHLRVTPDQMVLRK